MKIAIPFLARKPSTGATARAETALPRQAGRAAMPSATPHRLRFFARPVPTTYQRCLAAHIYLAGRKSALD